MKKSGGFLAALTGGIGAGKSEALEAFRRAGAAALSLDAVAHELCRPGEPAYRRVVSLFGPRFVGRDGRLDRKALASVVFTDLLKRRRLEAVIHPLILARMKRWLRRAPAKVKIVDVPLLFEKNLEKEFDAAICVTAPLALRRRRVRRRDGLSSMEFSRRTAAQMSQSRRAALADIVIANDGSRKDLRRKAREYHKAFELISSSGGHNG